MTVRPRLKPHLQPLLRGDGAVQFGTDPDRSVVVHGLAGSEVALLGRLDGTLDHDALTTWAAAAGVSPERCRTLLAVLRQHHLVVDQPADRADFASLPEPERTLLSADARMLAAAYDRGGDGYAVLARRRERHVIVDGRGGLAGTVSALLRRAGIGSVVTGPEGADEWLGGHGTLARGERAVTEAGPDLVVLTGRGALDATRAGGWRAHGIPHLPVLLEGAQAVVGPLVTAGGQPCLGCLDLARADLDPGWPALLGQLAPTGLGRPPETNGETALVAVAGGMAAMVALSALDGQPLPTGRSLEVGLPWPRVRQRQWEAHPACPCAAADTRGQPAAGSGAGQATMAG